VWHASAGSAFAAVLAVASGIGVVVVRVPRQLEGSTQYIQHYGGLGVAANARQVLAVVQEVVVAQVLDEVLPVEVL
jgi:adenine/guanine phosphoribosyltransferase-like PRPP-binding protein